MSLVKYEFRYMPLIGKLSGESMLQQTEQAINEIAEIVNENTAQADIINTLAQDANDNSVEALEKANEALETSSRVYIHEELAVNLDSYCESQLIYVGNIASTNLPIAKKGFLEVKTDDDKTECVQLFVSDDKDVYVRSGSITAETVGDITVYTADFEEWTSLSSPTILLQAGNGTSIPLSADLNDYNTEGTFYCSTTNVGSIAHCPVSEGEFKLIVMKFATANYGLQMLYPSGQHLYVRKYSGGAWGNWEVIIPKITSGVTNGSIAVNDTDVAVTGWNTKADLDSPVFVGTPTAPTPTASDDSTKIATTEFVHDNTDNKAPLASPALTGNPTAPTQATNNNSTRLATTEFVNNELSANVPLLGTNFTTVLTSNDDLNNVVAIGTYKWSDGTKPANAPTNDNNSNYCKMIVMGAQSVNYFYQLVFSHNGHIFKRRGRLDGGVYIFDPWKEFAYAEDVLPLSGGTVSGNVNIVKNSEGFFSIENTALTRGTNPASTTTVGRIKFNANGDKRLSEVFHSVSSSGDSKLNIWCQKNIAEDNFRRLMFVNPISGTPYFSPGDYNDNSIALGQSSLRWTEVYAATGSINTSDERLKDNIEAIPDEVLDAWGEVNWYQYQFKDSIEEKGETKARLHTGAIAQRIESVFESHNLDANRYGLLCYDEWEAIEEQKDEDGNILQEAMEAGNRYSLRYEEALCMEAAYQRRRADRLEDRIEALEKLLMNRTE